MKNPNNTRKLSFDLPGGEKAWFVLDLTYHSTLPEGMAESDLADLILAPLPVPCTRLTGSILLTPNGFSCHSHCEHYTFRWTADFHHKILLLDLLTVVKDQRGKGIGFHLFSHLVEWYGRYSFHHIRLSAEGGWIMNEPYRWNRLPDAAYGRHRNRMDTIPGAVSASKCIRRMILKSTSPGINISAVRKRIFLNYC